MDPPDQIDWAEIERLYITNESSVAEICRRFNIKSWKLYKRARDENWPRRRPRRFIRENAHNYTQSRGKGTLNAAMRRKEIITRLYRVLELKIEAIEERLVRSENMSTADDERDTRMINSLAQLYQKLTKTYDQAREAVRRSSQKLKTGMEGEVAEHDDADRLRADLAGRLARLRKRQNT